jgi:hypothetical protein
VPKYVQCTVQFDVGVEAAGGVDVQYSVGVGEGVAVGVCTRRHPGSVPDEDD